MTKKDWNVILREAEKGNLQSHSVSQLKKILSFNNNMPMDKAVEILKKCVIVSTHVQLNSNVMNNEMSKHKLNT
ncbi:MAG: hypothetical protein R6X33_11415, partial [Candidatus Brocadiia bacterium]